MKPQVLIFHPSAHFTNMYMYVCMHVSMYVGQIHPRMKPPRPEFPPVCAFYEHVCMYVCMQFPPACAFYKHVCMYVCMYAFSTRLRILQTCILFVCVYVCVYVCMHVSMYMCQICLSLSAICHIRQLKTYIRM